MGLKQNRLVTIVLLGMVAFFGVVFVAGVTVARVTAHTGSEGPQEMVASEYARQTVNQMLADNWFQPAVTVALKVDVQQAPEAASTGGFSPCADDDDERALVAHVDAQTLFGITLWSYEVTCTSGTLLSGV